MRAPSADYSSLSNAMRSRTSASGAYFNAKNASRWNIRNQLQEKQFALTDKGFQLQDRQLGLQGQSLDLNRKSLGLNERSLGLQDKALDIQGRNLELKGKSLDLSQENLDLNKKYSTINFILGMTQAGASLVSSLCSSYLNYKNAVDKDRVNKLTEINKSGTSMAEANIQSIKGDRSQINSAGAQEDADIELYGKQGKVPQAVARYKEELTKRYQKELDGANGEYKQKILDAIDANTVKFWSEYNSTIESGINSDYKKTMELMLAQSNEETLGGDESSMIEVSLSNGQTVHISKQSNDLIDSMDITDAQKDIYRLQSAEYIKKGKAQSFMSNFSENTSNIVRDYVGTTMVADKHMDEQGNIEDRVSASLDGVESQVGMIMDGVRNSGLNQTQIDSVLKNKSESDIKEEYAFEIASEAMNQGGYEEGIKAIRMAEDRKLIAVSGASRVSKLLKQIKAQQEDNIRSEAVSSSANIIERFSQNDGDLKTYNDILTATEERKKEFATQSDRTPEEIKAFNEALDKNVSLELKSKLSDTIEKIVTNKDQSAIYGDLQELKNVLALNMEQSNDKNSEIYGILNDSYSKVYAEMEALENVYGSSTVTTAMTQLKQWEDDFMSGNMDAVSYAKNIKSLYQDLHGSFEDLKSSNISSSVKDSIAKKVDSFDKVYLTALNSIVKKCTNLNSNPAMKEILKRFDTIMESRNLGEDSYPRYAEIKMEMFSRIASQVKENPENFTNESDAYRQMENVMNQLTSGPFLDLLNDRRRESVGISKQFDNARDNVLKLAKNDDVHNGIGYRDESGKGYVYSFENGWKVDSMLNDAMVSGDEADFKVIQEGLQANYFNDETETLGNASGLFVGDDKKVYMIFKSIRHSEDGNAQDIYFYDVKKNELYNSDFEKVSRLNLASRYGLDKRFNMGSNVNDLNRYSINESYKKQDGYRPSSKYMNDLAR